MSAHTLDLQRQETRKRSLEIKRRNQNAFNILMMLAILLAVIGTNDLFTAYLTNGKPIPLLNAQIQRPDLKPLGLGAAATTAENTQASDEVKGARALKIANRLDYLGFTTLYVVLCLVTLPLGAYVMFNTLRVYPPKEDSVWDAVTDNPTILLAWIAALILASIVAYHSYFYPTSPDVYQLLQQTVEKDFSRGHGIRLYQIFNALAMGVTIYLAAIAVCVIWHARFQPYDPNSGVPEERYRIETEACYLGVQLKQLRLVLYISTAVLILRIIQLDAGMNWVLAWVIPPKGPVYEDVKALVNNMVLVRALYNTTLLAAIYLPTAAVLSERIAKLADQENSGKTTADRQKWLDDRGLSFNFMAHVPNLIAILGPLLASPVKDLLGHISSH
ncbi:MAG TPA: hypothetical protein VFA07_16140 [Chthonomonadaceae bacterium]|nr:hypothetical protein [Chthonomonadaceae bacterium]